MSVDLAVDLTREAALIALFVGAPILLVGMLVGLIVSMLQAVTQVQEQTLSFVPKIIAMVVAMVLLLPWMMTRMIEYTSNLVEQIPSSLTP